MDAAHLKVGSLVWFNIFSFVFVPIVFNSNVGCLLVMSLKVETSF